MPIVKGQLRGTQVQKALSADFAVLLHDRLQSEAIYYKEVVLILLHCVIGFSMRVLV